MNQFFDQFPVFYTSPVSAHPNRLHQRYRAIIEPNRLALAGAKVLAIGAHDGVGRLRHCTPVPRTSR